MEGPPLAILHLRRPGVRRATGQVAEWLKAPVLKTGGPSRVSWVRIPPCPLYHNDLAPPELWEALCAWEGFGKNWRWADGLTARSTPWARGGGRHGTTPRCGLDRSTAPSNC